MDLEDKGNSVFKVPKGYFQSLPDKIMEGIKDEDTVFADKSKNLFGVPDGYFDSLSGRLMQPIEFDKPIAKERPVRWIAVLRTAAAAVVAVLISIFGVVQIEKLNDNTIGTPQSFSQNQLDAYAFDESLLVEEYLETIQTKKPKESPIEEYLIINADESLLLSEL